MNRLLLLLFLSFPFAGSSQNFIGRSKAQVKKELQRQVVKNDTLVIELTSTDTTLVYSYNDKKVAPVKFIYEFGRSGQCRSEKVLAACSTCLDKYLQGVLAQKKFGWKKINENQYVSSFDMQMMIELPGDNKDFSYSILRTDWSRDMYDTLKGN